jgi:hypothetical protein
LPIPFWRRKKDAGFLLAATGFGIALAELLAAAFVPRRGDIIYGPGLSILFLPLTALGLILSHWARREARKQGQRPTWGSHAALVMGYLVIPVIYLASQLALSNPAGRRLLSDSGAVAKIRTLNTAEGVYRLNMGGKFGGMPDLIRAGLLDARFDDIRSGYRFTVTATASEYTATATPVSRQIGIFGYFSTSDGVVRYATRATDGCNPCFPDGQGGQPVQ